MTQIELRQFQRQLCLSDSVLCHLLRENKLPVAIDPSRGLLVHVTDTTVQEVVQALKARTTALPGPAQEVLSEMIGTALREVFDRATDRALEALSAERNND